MVCEEKPVPTFKRKNKKSACANSQVSPACRQAGLRSTGRSSKERRAVYSLLAGRQVRWVTNTKQSPLGDFFVFASSGAR